MTQPLSYDDVVPALRLNLAFNHAPAGLGAGQVWLKDVLNGDEYALHGFEHSLARMLDGRRTAKEVLAAAAQLGMPLTLLDLNGFVRRLEARHLVRTSAQAGDDELIALPFPTRAAWDDQTRSQYRTALREGRAGHLDRALGALDDLIDEHPEVPEAKVLFERLEEKVAAPEQRAFQNVFAEAERGWQADAVPERATPRTSRTKWFTIGAAALAALALGVAFIPLPHTVIVPATLAPVVSGTVRAPRTGTVLTVDAAPGRWVEQGAVLFTYDATEELRQLGAAVARLGRMNDTLYAALPATPETRAALARLAAAETALSMAEQNPVDPTLTVALREVADARAALDVQVPAAQLAEVLEQRAWVQALELQVLESEVKAPVAGAITAMNVTPNGRIYRNDDAVKLEDTRQLEAVAPVKDPGVEAGQTVLVLANGRAENTTVQRVANGTVRVLIDNPQQVFAPGAAELQIKAKAMPLAAR